MTRSGKRIWAGLALFALVISACTGGAPSPTSSPAPSADRASATPTPVSATPSLVPSTPSPSPLLAIADLPRVELADIDATAVCDPYPNQANIDAGQSTIICSEGLELAFRAVRAVTEDPVGRLYLHRPTCASLPCTADELSTAEVTAWTPTRALSVRLDSRLAFVSEPLADEDAVWPPAGNGPNPAVKRPSITGAPREVRDRDPYPFCGMAEIGDPPQVLGCFRDAVLAGRRAEMIQRLFGTEGGELLVIYRYDGQGRLVAYEHNQTVGGDGQTADTWRRAEGAMILGITSQSWDIETWWGTDQAL